MRASRLCRPFMSAEQFAAIDFAEPGAVPGVSAANLPSELGGHADWNLEDYIVRRCVSEKVCSP